MTKKKEEIKEIIEEQVVEVEYNKDLVEDYKSNYIMEEEGIGADPDIIPYDIQNNINEVSLEDMIEEGEVIIEEVINND